MEKRFRGRNEQNFPTKGPKTTLRDFHWRVRALLLWVGKGPSMCTDASVIISSHWRTKSGLGACCMTRNDAAKTKKKKAKKEKSGRKIPGEINYQQFLIDGSWNGG